METFLHESIKTIEAGVSKSIKGDVNESFKAFVNDGNRSAPTRASSKRGL